VATQNVLAIYSSFVTVLLLVSVSMFATDIEKKIVYEPSIDCVYSPPDVSLPEMHSEIRQLLLDEFPTGTQGAILMNGAFVTTRYDTDVEQVFRQESNFLYVTGYDQPNATVVMDINTRKTILFIPDRPEDYAIWNGNIESPAQISEKYLIPEVYYQWELPAILQNLASTPNGYTIYVMNEHTEVPDKEQYTINDSELQEMLYNAREVKTHSELELMRYAASVSSGAHEIVMNYTKPGLYEYNIEGRFLDGCFACGLTIQSYIPICASGNNSAILHYVSNDRLMKDGDLLLIDAGAEYNGYGTDITRTYPVNGVFTDIQREVYNMVLEVQTRVINRVYPDVSWKTLQDYSEEYTCDLLVAFGYLNSTSQECIDYRLYTYFFPHTVGHYIGLDVHDRFDPRFRYLKERNVITVEPGIYFNEALLGPILSDAVIGHFFVASKIQPLLDSQFGGVRIEDVVIVWENGPEVISFPPKSVFAIENHMSTQ